MVDNSYNLIKEYSCIRYAAEELSLHITHIQDVCEHRYTNTGGYVFMYYSEYIDMVNNGAEHKAIDIKPYRKPVNQFNLDGLFLRQFSSIKEAAREINGDSKSISQACKGVLKTSGGFKWEFAKFNNELKEFYNGKNKKDFNQHIRQDCCRKLYTDRRFTMAWR